MRAGAHEFGVEYRRVITDENYEKALGSFLVERAQA